MKNKDKSIPWLMGIAVILEWINIVLFLASLGRTIDISIYNKLKDFEYISNVFYISAITDSIIFGILFYKYQKQNNEKQMLLMMFCSLLQLVLIIYKLNIW